MKKTFIRILSLLCACLMLVPMIAACKKDEEPQDTVNVGTVNTQGQTVADIIGFDEEDNGGKKFTILVSTTDQSEHYAEAYNGEIVNDSVYERNLLVEQYLGIDLEVIVEPGGIANKADFNSTITTPISAGDCAHDMIVGVTAIISSTFGSTYYLPVNKMEYIDLSKNWWVNKQYDKLQINGNLYNLFGDMNLSLYSEIHGIMFNSQMIANNDLEDPYDLVANNQWTYEKYFEMAAKAGQDRDGIEGCDIDRDVMGIVGCTNPQRAFMTGLGLEVVTRDASTGDPMFPDSLSEKFINAYEMMSNNMALTYNTFLEAEDDDYTEALKAMASDRLLFLPSYLYFMTDPLIAGMEGDFGIVPYPKYDAEDQEQYYSQIATGATTTVFPKTLTTPELSAKVATYMSYLGYETVTVKYYETYLKDRLSRSPEMQQMLDLIRDTATMNLTTVYAGAIKGVTLNNFFEVSYITDHKDTLASVYKTKLRSMRSGLKTIINAYAE